ncbi:3-ketoacyl-ACP reductase [Clostridia bacterium]|nr:3-ketoacyl-ACP reductase [Clostridia bacterium]
MANRLVGKSAVVTGAASGMGGAIAVAYLQEGANIIAADINEAGLEELSKKAAELGVSEHFKSIKCNITEDEDCTNAIQACVDTFGTCNVLSSNAGIMDDFSMVEEIVNAKWDHVIHVNLTGQMKICRAALQYFVPNDIKASIVMITSNAAFESATGGPAYCASKAGANALMKAIAFEYARKGIRCNSICPGPVATNIGKSVSSRSEIGFPLHYTTGYNAHYTEWGIKTVGVPEDIAPLSVFLASDESNFVNSSSIIIDGGVCLG